MLTFDIVLTHEINAGRTKMTVLLSKGTADKVHHHINTKLSLLASSYAVTDLYIGKCRNACNSNFTGSYSSYNH